MAHKWKLTMCSLALIAVQWSVCTGNGNPTAKTEGAMRLIPAGYDHKAEAKFQEMIAREREIENSMEWFGKEYPEKYRLVQSLEDANFRRIPAGSSIEAAVGVMIKDAVATREPATLLQDAQRLVSDLKSACSDFLSHFKKPLEEAYQLDGFRNRNWPWKWMQSYCEKVLETDFNYDTRSLQDIFDHVIAAPLTKWFIPEAVREAAQKLWVRKDVMSSEEVAANLELFEPFFKHPVFAGLHLDQRVLRGLAEFETPSSWPCKSEKRARRLGHRLLLPITRHYPVVYNYLLEASKKQAEWCKRKMDLKMDFFKKTQSKDLGLLLSLDDGNIQRVPKDVLKSACDNFLSSFQRWLQAGSWMADFEVGYEQWYRILSDCKELKGIN